MSQTGADIARHLHDELDARIEGVVRAWRTALAPTSYVPLSAAEQRAALTRLTRELLEIVQAEPFLPAQAAAIGAELVKIGYSRPSALGRTLEVFGRELTVGLSEPELRRIQPQLARVLAEIASGFATQLTGRILADQETIREALLTQRDEAEQAMRESEARFRAIFEAAPFSIAVADMQGRVLAANRALQSIAGYSEEEMLGRVILAELAHPDEAEAGYRAFLELAEGRTDRYEIEQRFIARDGREVWVQLAMALVRDDEGRPQFAIGMGEDITSRKEAEEKRLQLLREQAARAEAEEAIRAREQFLSVAAHELKTPVTSLRGFAQLTLRALDQEGELDRTRLRQALTVVNQQSDKLTRLVAQLLDISRIHAGRLALELRTVDLTQLIDDVVTAMQHQSQYHTLQVISPSAMFAEIDALRIEQVLTNLIDNAIKYSPQGGPIEISVTPVAESQVQVAVRDHGPGIAAEHREHIFERFYQAGAAAEHAAGMGLGLFISREIVELHGGSITAEFPSEGGACFIITLPVAERPTLHGE